MAYNPFLKSKLVSFNFKKEGSALKKVFKDFKYSILIILFLTILSIAIVNYNNAQEAIRDKYEKQQQLIENSILQTIHHVSDAYTIAEKYLNQEMKEYSMVLREKYKQNPNIENWDLKKLKKQFGAYDIYIINSDLEVIRSTFEKDIGLDFSRYPGFAKLLKKRLAGDSFEVDRLNLSTKTGVVKKYSYIPTPDHQYLLELSIDVKEKFAVLKNLDIFFNALEITKEYDSVEEISFYKINPNNQTVGELRNTKKPYVNTNVSKTEKELAKKAFLKNQTQKKVSQSSDNHIAKYIPAIISTRNDGTKWWNSFVVGIKYNRQSMIDEIDQHWTLFTINIMIMILVFIVFILVVTYLLRKFEYLAYHDQLTKLPNRNSFTEKVNDLIKVVDKKDNKLAVLFLDIDDFKSINDNYGHNIGDKVLKATADKLREVLRKRDAISRIGGDEFALAISDLNSSTELNKVVKRIFNNFEQPLVVEEKKLLVSVSIGISIYPDDGSNLEELIKQADYAMYEAKEQKNDYTFYQE